MFLLVHTQDDPDTHKVQRDAKESIYGNCFIENIGVLCWEKKGGSNFIEFKQISRSAT